MEMAIRPQIPIGDTLKTRRKVILINERVRTVCWKSAIELEMDNYANADSHNEEAEISRKFVIIIPVNTKHENKNEGTEYMLTINTE